MGNRIVLAIGFIVMGGFIYMGIGYDLNTRIPKYKADRENILFEITANYDTIYDNANTEELEDRSDCIIIGNVKSIDDVINYSEKTKEYMMTSTIGTITINNIIKSNQIIGEDNEIPFIRVGGTISVAEYEKSLEPRQVIRQGINNMTQEEKENTYVKFSYENDVEIEEGKDYLIYLKYEQALDTYRIIGMEYGLKEYNGFTNEVKDNETDSWEAIQYNL